MNINLRVEMQKSNYNKIRYHSILEQVARVNENSALDNYIIAKVSARDRFILRPQEYNLFVQSAVEDIEKNLDELLKDF